ncbi:Minor fimbrial protein prsF precursor [Serratia entomophila]|nr:fimbrial protein [Serratia entomophila]CAI0719944.1 Minor fimbrial protein prsF precursor [Serratia entomophila]CAI0720998.1 Minor fimbrial protein prsF precursor [Serratia entomophila]CAI0721121.1 Minor fimbrial protein prsF precursor [Serratia entomophila]CAI0732035.1 Minor fimbrial protein prsF precursor [Serratia entomophila]
MENSMKRSLAPLWLGGLLALSALPTQATTATVNVRVTVLSPPCVINGGRTIEVDFGDSLIITRVDGNNYTKAVDYTLTCTGNSSNAMKLQVMGNPTAFEPSALQTSVADLGIALKANGGALAVNEWLDFTYPNAPQLQAVPVKRAGATLAGGEFTAAATLRVDYQ